MVLGSLRVDRHAAVHSRHHTVHRRRVASRLLHPVALRFPLLAKHLQNGFRRMLPEYLDEGRAAVVVDPSQLEMAVLNLAVNSRDAMPRGGTLKVSTCTRRHSDEQLTLGDYVVVTVADTGAGKTLAGFLPTLAAFAPSRLSGASPRDGPHTLYVSPLKALATDSLGATAESNEVGILVNNPPTVDLVSPQQGAGQAGFDFQEPVLDTIRDRAHRICSGSLGSSQDPDLVISRNTTFPPSSRYSRACSIAIASMAEATSFNCSSSR